MNKPMFYLECLEAGILPPPNGRHTSPHDFLQQLSPEEAKAARRKFRKMHRKIRKRKIARLEKLKTKKNFRRYRKSTGNRAYREAYCDSLIEENNRIYGRPDTTPSKNQMRNRRRIVYSEISKRIPKNV